MESTKNEGVDVEALWVNVSVIMPVYNRSKVVVKAVSSVLNQSYKNFELIIVDDCSTDDSIKIISGISDSRVKLFKLEKNSGAAAARNFGIKKSIGKFISFLDSDDEYLEDFLSTSIDTLSLTPKSIGFMWTGSYLHQGTKIDDQIWRPAKGKNSYLTFLQDIRIGTGAGVTLKKNVFEKCGYFNENLPAAEDTDFFLRISKSFDFTYIDAKLINIYRDNTDRMSRNYKNLAIAYNLFIKDHFIEIDKDPNLKVKYYYKLMWLNFHISHPDNAKYYFSKIPKNEGKTIIKAFCIYGLYQLLPLKLASFIHLRASLKLS